MRLRGWKPSNLFKIGMFFLIASGSASAVDGKFSDLKEDDGTYAVYPVSSQEQCVSLCKSDSQTCRGSVTVTYKEDDVTVSMQCRLNNGSGINAIFPDQAPEPFDLNKATDDLNAYRAQFGLQPVRLNVQLNKASEVHARDLASAGIISHTGTDGSTHVDRVETQGYNYSMAAENVAVGQRSWEEVFKAWQDSPGHNENLLRDNVVDFGIALVYEPETKYSTYWAMLVASPLEVYNQRSDYILRTN